MPKKKKRKVQASAAPADAPPPTLPNGDPHPGYDEEEFAAEALEAAMYGTSSSGDDGFNQSSSDEGGGVSGAAEEDEEGEGAEGGRGAAATATAAAEAGGSQGEGRGAGSTGPTAGELYEQYYCGARTQAALDFSDDDIGRLCADGSADGAFDSAFDGGGVVAITRAPLLAKVECARAIALAEAHAAAREAGWTTSRHYAVPTTDIPVASVPELLGWFNGFCETRLFPLIAHCYHSSPVGGGHFGPDALRVKDAFVVKYDAAAGQTGLPKHKDQSDFSVTIALNGADEYGGGGTRFSKLKAVARPGRGHVVAFEGGELSHSGVKITRGTRYILAVFMDVMFV